jgi:CRISPR-associated protein Cmr6
MVIPNAARQVPLMFRAQAPGRCQVAYLQKGEEPDAVIWTDEWVKHAETYPDRSGTEVRTQDSTIAWRLLTNSGLDDSVILPVLGAKGIPYFPGSSMKGLFRRACNRTQADRYCGKPLPGNDWQPGILRFHGGYPVDDSWTQDLVDIVHPQQNWQVKGAKEGGAFPLISLYKPTLRFGISSTQNLDDSEWETIWDIWQKALANGIGSRVSAGYGQIETSKPEILFKAKLKGQGQAPKLLTGDGEFRPNMIRAAIRGHALRIFGGLTSEDQAERLVEQLFGGIQKREGRIGLLGLKFVDSHLDLDKFGKGKYTQPCYSVEGELTWYLTQPLTNPEHEIPLKKLVTALNQFALVFGGFGKSWRRADHRLFFEDYYEDPYKALIGCHWRWMGTLSLTRHARKVYSPKHIRPFIEEVLQIARDWMKLQNIQPRNFATAWREAWHPSQVQVWGRVAEDQENSEAIYWFHGPYRKAQAGLYSEGSIYHSDFVGKVGKVGQIWHRMYPLVRFKPDPKDDSKKIAFLPLSHQFLELITLFPDESQECEEFLDFLGTHPFNFEQLWGDQ